MIFHIENKGRRSLLDIIVTYTHHSKQKILTRNPHPLSCSSRIINQSIQSQCETGTEKSNFQPPTPPQPDSSRPQKPKTLPNAINLLANSLGILDSPVHKGLGGCEIGRRVLRHDGIGAGVDGRDGQTFGVPGCVDGGVAGQSQDVG